MDTTLSRPRPQPDDGRDAPARSAPAAPAPRQATPRSGTPAAAFDRWLRRELARLYGAALHEPVPDSLLRMITEALPPRRKR
ncbi:hypothetical protein [Caldovatus aquaticus]|uniref:Anti-sigma factor NepR domain-containing protein n=1 Tax=Caldovatus aquaticus TaxID=2865671 RepID=A0ABS7F1Q7_9PROT|nr:hypothetical protein [Caldovatus aquaticus]MBW8269553.1 hypothetical protein [Caldovatus aquaticus]